MNIRILFSLLLLIPSTAGCRQIERNELESEIGQMLLIGFRGTDIDSDSPILKTIRSLNIGGVVLFDYDVPSKSYPRNIENAGQVRRLTRRLREASAEPLLISVDAEGGLINRLKPKYGFLEIPSASEMGRKRPEDCLAVYAGLAGQLAELGINLNLAPVVDLNLNPDNPVIGSLERSFGPQAADILPCVKAFVRAHHRNGVLTTLKHFPGHGSSAGDSHLGLVDVTKTHSPDELGPYRELIAEGLADAVMTAHIHHRDIDPDFPATLSLKFLQDILRKELGFDGVIISDDMQMGAITEHYGFEEAVVLAVRAGCDIIAIANNGKVYDEEAPHKARRAILQAVRDGVISSGHIRQSLRRIRTLKERLQNQPQGLRSPGG
jgi:beta-N-acetylhexosaminidase